MHTCLHTHPETWDTCEACKKLRRMYDQGREHSGEIDGPQGVLAINREIEREMSEKA